MYPGWYSEAEAGSRPLDTIDPHIDRVLGRLQELRLDDRPFLISEIGAGALYGWRDPLKAHWSEEYQADLLGVVCRRVMEDPRILGVSLWQFCDARTYSDSQALRRPRAFNNKGLFDEYRRAKAAVQTVSEIFGPQ
jgi:beta-glucuronidase